MSRLAWMATLLVLWMSYASRVGSQSLDEARALYGEGRVPEALELFQALARAGGEDPDAVATAHHNACYLLIFELPDFEAARDHCAAAVELRRGLGDELRLARTLNILGLVLQNLGSYAEAEKYFREALEINERQGDAEGVVVNLSNLGALAQESGRYTEAMETLERALDVAYGHPEAPWSRERIFVIRINYGAALEKVGAYREALSVYELALETAGGFDDPEALAGRVAAVPRAALQVNRGVMYRNLGDPVQAVEAFQKAVEIYAAVGDTTGLANACLNLGLARHLNLDQRVAAEEDYRRALEHARESEARSEEIQVHFYLGRLLLEQGRLDEAEEAYDACLAVATAGGSAEGRWSGFEGLGRILERRGDLPAAFEHLVRAIGEIERVREGLGHARRGGYFGDKRAVYAAAVRVLAELAESEPDGGYPERALELVQQAKARELIDVLGGEPGRAAPLSAEELKARVGGGELIELFVGEQRVFGWRIAGGTVRMVDLGPASPILDRVAEVHRALASGEEPAGDVLRWLSRALLDPLAVSASGAPLWIASDGRLDYLPFELLELGGKELVDRRPVSYLPSASTLAWLRRDEAPPELGLAGLGDPSLGRRREVPAGGGPVASFARPAELLVDRFRLMPLPRAAEELEAIGRHLPGEHEIRLGAEATEAALRRVVSRGSRVLHLATHSVVDERPGRGAAILLTAEGSDDGILQPEEIAGLDLRTRLTVLASCSSALGPNENGRALASLTGAFLAAGSPAVVATLWDVDDGATAVFMEQFYFHLAAGRPPADALRRAKQRLRADPRWDRPALWAAYVLIGDAPAVVAGAAWALWTFAGLTLSLVALALALRARSNSTGPHSRSRR